MASTDPLWLPSLSFDETELRKMDSVLIMADGTALGSRPGIRPGDPGLAVSLAGTTVNVSGGTATLYRSGQGVYRAQLAATSPGTLTAANATFARVDLVYLRVWDTAIDSSGLRKADTVYLAGTASGSPVAPTPGATEIYIPLATINVPNTGGGGTGAATVSSLVRQITVAPGGILPVSTAADIALAGTYAGQVRYNAGVLEYWSGAAWIAVNPPLTSVFTESSTIATTNNTSWGDATVIVSTTVTVPPSGKVAVFGQSQLYQATSSFSAYSALHVTGSTSGTIRAAADLTALRIINFNTGDNNIIPATTAFRVTGVAGETLTIKWQHRVSGGAAQFDYRNILAIPLAG